MTTLHQPKKQSITPLSVSSRKVETLAVFLGLYFCLSLILDICITVAVI